MNSPLSTFKYSKPTDHYNPRDHKIDRITIHHMAGNLTCQSCADILQSRGGSVNYMVQTDGKIGVMIDEKYRAWTTSSRYNDMRAVTLEVADDTNASGNPPWHVSDKALKATINLCADICKRNGFKLNYTGDDSGNLTMHRWYAATGCPEQYLASKFPYIASEVNKKLEKAVITNYTHTDTAIRINWNSVLGAVGYRIYRYNPKTKKWETLKTVKNELTFRDAGLKPNTEYKYKVKAYFKEKKLTRWGNASDSFKAVTKEKKK